MRNKILSLQVFLFLSFNALAFTHGSYFHQRSLLMQSNKMAGEALKLRFDGSLRTQEVAFYEQKLNHKDSSSTKFKQRYFVDSQYAEDLNSPVFYIICGEWNCAGTGSYSFVEGLAKKFKAHLIALEHRYYGESLPTNVLTSEAMEFLNLESAIEDLASFQRYMMTDKGFQGKWVSFGGSYAGTLAAFYREKHPELVMGSLASSAPVLMKNEFKEYDAHVAKVINKTNCGDKVREAVALIEEKLTTPEGTLEVKETFKATELTNDKDFLYVVADMLAAAVQYGRNQIFCNALEGNTDLVLGYAKGGLAVLSALGATPYDISLAVAGRQTVTPDDNMRQWMWQSCREFGWFQVANGTGPTTSRSAQIDLAYHEDVCQRMYGIQMGSDGALNSQWYSPLFDPETTHIVFTNGSNDPWQTLSIVPGQLENEEIDLFMMEGAAHCNDLRLMTNLPGVLEAHGKIEMIVSKWLR